MGDGEGGTFGVSETQEIEVPVEYDSLGLSTGVEAEEQASEPLIHDPFDPAKIDVITRTMTVDLLLARIRRGVLDLAPDFQRFAGIWNDVAQSKLIESLLLRIPLPTLYAAESGDESWVVVDGIQRLTAIARFVDPSIVGASPLRLHGVEYLQTYEGATYQQLPGALQTRIDETELIVHLIRAGTPEPVKFNIFARLNTGGTPLTLQELRHALIPGRARTLLKELANGEPFRDATQGSVKPQRMADREMVLRFLAFRLTTGCAISVGACWPDGLAGVGYRSAARSETSPPIARKVSSNSLRRPVNRWRGRHCLNSALACSTQMRSDDCLCRCSS